MDNYTNPIQKLKYESYNIVTKIKLSKKQRALQNAQHTLADFISKEDMAKLERRMEAVAPQEEEKPKMIEVPILYKQPEQFTSQPREPSKKLSKHKKEVYKHRYEQKREITSKLFQGADEETLEEVLKENKLNCDINALEGKELNDFIKAQQNLKMVKPKDVKMILGHNETIEYFAKYAGVQEDAIRSDKVIREYVDMRLDPTLDADLGRYLIKLRDMYFRKVKAAPLKAKRRFVAGMNETKKQIKLGYAKMVILVPDIEKVEGKNGLDEKLLEILAAAREFKVPVHYGFEKFALGKILRNKNSCIYFAALVNVEGFEMEYKDLVNRVLGNRREWYIENAKENKENVFLDGTLLKEILEYQGDNELLDK